MLNRNRTELWLLLGLLLGGVLGLGIDSKTLGVVSLVVLLIAIVMVITLIVISNRLIRQKR